MNRYQSILDNVHKHLVADLCAEVNSACFEKGEWIIVGEKIAYRGEGGAIYPFDFANNDPLSQAIVALFNAAESISRNLE